MSGPPHQIRGLDTWHPLCSDENSEAGRWLPQTLSVGVPPGATTSQQPLSGAAWKPPASSLGSGLHFHSNLNLPLSTSAPLKAESQTWCPPKPTRESRLLPLQGLCPVPPKPQPWALKLLIPPPHLALSLRGVAPPWACGRVNLALGEASLAAYPPPCSGSCKYQPAAGSHPRPPLRPPRRPLVPPSWPSVSGTPRWSFCEQ